LLLAHPKPNQLQSTFYSRGFVNQNPAIAGQPKPTPTVASYLVVDFSWYRYSLVFYPLIASEFPERI